MDTEATAVLIVATVGFILLALIGIPAYRHGTIDVTRHVPRWSADGRLDLLRGVVGASSLTNGLLSANALLFIATMLGAADHGWLIGGGAVPPLILEFGVISPAVARGELWRLITAGFFHFGLVHLAFNMIALFVVGRYCERYYGALRFGAIYLVALLGGNVLAAITSDARTVTAGASGAILGAFAAMAIVAIRYPSEDGALQDSILPIFLTLSNGFTHSGVSNAAHIGGVIVGGLGAWMSGIAPHWDARLRLRERTARERDLLWQREHPRRLLPASILADPANRLELRVRWTWYLLFGGAAVVSAMGTAALASSGKEPIGTAAGGVAALVFGAATLALYRSRLLLTPEGFEYRIAFRRLKIAWHDVGSFGVRDVSTGYGTVVSITYQYRPAYVAARRARGERVFGLDRPQSLPGMYGHSPEQVARLLESWRARWTSLLEDR